MNHPVDPSVRGCVFAETENRIGSRHVSGVLATRQRSLSCIGAGSLLRLVDSRRGGVGAQRGCVLLETENRIGSRHVSGVLATRQRSLRCIGAESLLWLVDSRRGGVGFQREGMCFG